MICLRQTTRGAGDERCELAGGTSAQLDALRGLVRIGPHWNVEASDAADPSQLVSQACCSALPVAYSRGDSAAQPRPALRCRNALM